MSEIRQKNKTEIEQQIKEQREALSLLRREIFMGRVKKTNQIREKRKEIARLKTVLSEFEIIGGKSE